MIKGMRMKTVAVNEKFIQGALSVKRVGAVLYPCRLPYQRRHLFLSPQDNLLQRALCASGVRLRMETDTESITLIKNHIIYTVMEIGRVTSKPVIK